MIRLSTLGGLAVSNSPSAGSGAPTARRLAILAVLAAAGGRPVSRDRLLALLWPDTDEPRARHALTQALYALRRELGQPDLLIGTAELRLNEEVVRSDLLEFSAALREGDLPAAVQAYGGPFLDGVHLDDAADFSHWCDVERERLARQFSQLLERLAERDMAAGDLASAAKWWQRLSEVEPLDSRIATAAIKALVGSGNRALALHALRKHETALREQLGLELPAELSAQGHDLARATPRHAAVAAADRAPESLSETSAEPVLSVTRRTEPWRWAIPVAALLGLLSVALLDAPQRGSGPPADSAASAAGFLAVLPFNVHGDSAAHYIGAGVAELLSTGLDGTGILRVVAPRTRRFLSTGQSDSAPPDIATVAANLNARYIVTGDVVAAHGRLRVIATLYRADTPGTLVGQATAEGPEDRLFALCDDIARELLGELHLGAGTRLVRSAAATTSSLRAFKAYVEGDVLLRAGRFSAALAALQAAVAADTSFTLAYYRLSEAADWNSLPDLARSAGKEALRRAGRLGWRDRMLVEGIAAWRAGDADKAETIYQTLLTRYADDMEGWSQLGEVLFHTNPWRGRSFVEARAPFERVLKLEADNSGALSHLLRIAAYEGRTVEADTMVVRLEGSDRVSLVRASLRKDARLFSHLMPPTIPPIPAEFEASRLAMHLHDLSGAERVLSLLLDAKQPVPARAYGFALLAHLAAAQGQLRRAFEYSRRLKELDPIRGLELEATLAVMPFWTIDRGQIGAIARELERADLSALSPGTGDYFERLPGARFQIRSYLLGLLASRLGDSVKAESRIAALRTRPVQSDGGNYGEAFAAGVAAELELRRDSSAALKILETSGLRADLEAHKMQSGGQTLERFRRAELLASTGRIEEALGWFEGIGQQSPYELLARAPSQLRRGDLLVQLGRVDEARRAYGEVIQLWKDCDPVLRPLVEEAKRRSAALVSR